MPELRVQGSRGRSRDCVLAVVAGLVVVLCLGAATSAMAWRKPTRSERSAIARAARQTPTVPNKTIHVRNIHVSTVGPWASAGVGIYFGKTLDSATAILHKVHGKWINAGAGTDGEWCVMPLRDQRDLGFPVGSSTCKH